jgi:predicted Zn finger-like uncharacterized protein
MFTVCPKCALTLVVTAADLKVAQGYVRCGRCSNVFNAIAALSDEMQTPPGLEGYIQPEPPPPSEEKLEFDPVATNVSDVFVEPQIGDNEATGTFEAIVLETGEPDPTEPDDAAAPAPDTDAQLHDELQTLAKRIAAESQPVPAAAVVAYEARAPQIDEAAQIDEPQRALLWRVGIALFALTLAAQVIHHYRHDLAVFPQLRAPLTALYRTLGVSLVPRWNVDAYEVRQLGAASSATSGNQLTVRASVKNAAHEPLPLPLLRVVVQDRFGNRLAARDVTPESYASHATRAHALLAAGQRIDVEINFLDPGKDAVGFEIDACLASPEGDVNCTNR